MAKTHKLTCNVTGNWSYVTDANWKKLCTQYGSEADLVTNWVSAKARKLRNKLANIHFPGIRKGKDTTYGMLLESQREKIDHLILVMRDNGDLIPSDRIVDIITGEQLPCSPDRMQTLIDNARVFNLDADESTVRETYVSRSTKRRMRELAVEISGEGKGWNDLSHDQQETAKAQIRAEYRAANGHETLPAVESHDANESIVDNVPVRNGIPKPPARPVRQKGRIPA